MQIFDKEGALARCDGDKDLLLELINICIEDSDQRLIDIKKAGEDNDPKMLQMSAHSMKSAMGNVGGVECYNILFKLEKLGQSGTVTGYAELYNELIEKFKLFQELALKL